MNVQIFVKPPLTLDHNNLGPVCWIVHNSEGFISDATSIPKKIVSHLETFGVWGFYLSTFTLIRFVPCGNSTFSSYFSKMSEKDQGPAPPSLLSWAVLVLPLEAPQVQEPV